MNIMSMNCVSCGAPIQVPPDIDQFTCAHCGTTLAVQRGEGYIALKVAEHLSKAISETGQQTRAAISEGTHVTQAELKRLQITQDLSAAQMQLSSIQAEIRALERQKKNGTIKKQLKQLHAEEENLLCRIRSLRSSVGGTTNYSTTNLDRQKAIALEQRAGAERARFSNLAAQNARREQLRAEKAARRTQVEAENAAWRASQPAKTAFLKTPLGGGCAAGCLSLILAGLVCPFVGSGIDVAFFNGAKGSMPFTALGFIAALIIPVIAFSYKLKPEARIWAPLKKRLHGKRNQSNVGDAPEATVGKPVENQAGSSDQCSGVITSES